MARILIADEDAGASHSLADTLRRANFDVEIATTAATACDVAEIELPDLIVVDLMTSNPDGVELCRALNAAGLDTPVVFFTYCDTIADRVRGLDAGAYGYLAKTADTDHLVAVVRAIVRRAAPDTTPQPP
jgi:two-component system, OmpR family, response regulator MprA